MGTINPPLGRKLRMGLVGGGGNAFIGPVHWTAATLDHRSELVAAALSSNPETALRHAPEFGVGPEGAFRSWQAMIAAQAEQPAESRLDFVSIATPNVTHYPIAAEAIRAGLNVICDKPMTVDSEQAGELVELVKQHGVVFAVSHNYSGYPMVRQAREMIADGELGSVFAVRVQYMQGWIWSLQPGVKPARGAWKSDPALAGPTGTLADIGTHAYHLARFVTEMAPQELACQLRTFAPGRAMDDYGHISLRCADGLLALITVSQVTHGRLNDVLLEVDGTSGSLQWRQETPNELVVRRLGRPVQIYERNPNVEYLSESARASSRIPGGHPEGFYEAFANIYRAAFDDMVQRAVGEPFDSRASIYPDAQDGLEGVRFIEACLASQSQDSGWTSWAAES